MAQKETGSTGILNDAFSQENLDKAHPGSSEEDFDNSLLGAVSQENHKLKEYLDEKNRLKVDGKYMFLNGNGDITWVDETILREHGSDVFKMSGVLTVSGDEPGETINQTEIREMIENSAAYGKVYPPKKR